MSRALDKNGDWSFGQGKQSYKTEADALHQNIITRLSQWYGDCFYAPTDGVDWTNLLDIGTRVLLDLDIKRVILQTVGVLQIRDYSSTINSVNRNVSIQCTIDTIFGTLPISEVV